MKTSLIVAACLVYLMEASAVCIHGTTREHADCNKYYKCYWGVVFEVLCPYPLRFNPSIDVCDWPGNVLCIRDTNLTSPNACGSSPCVNGECYESSTAIRGYNCSCTTGFSGETCQTITSDSIGDKCLSNPCVRGTCTTDNITYTCTCPLNYGGDRCQFFVGSNKNCNPNPCKNSGQCSESAFNSNGFVCSCVGSYTGPTCETVSS